MKQVSIGPNGPKVANLGIGAMSFSDFYGSTSDENSFALLDAAIAAGVTHIDTSNVYGMGRSERAIGAYIAQNGGAALRDKLHIATKAGIARDALLELGYTQVTNVGGLGDALRLKAEMDKKVKAAQ